MSNQSGMNGIENQVQNDQDLDKKLEREKDSKTGKGI